MSHEAEVGPVIVEWLDSQSPRGWVREDEFPEELKQPMRVRTVGWIVETTDDAITIAGSIVTEEGQKQWHGIMVIPIISITKQTKLKD